MRIRKIRLYAAGFFAFLLGVPLTEQAMAQDVGSIIDASLGLASAITASAGQS